MKYDFTLMFGVRKVKDMTTSTGHGGAGSCIYQNMLLARDKSCIILSHVTRLCMGEFSISLLSVDIQSNSRFIKFGSHAMLY